MKPEILTHPNIPKPLHGLNPRTIMGQEWWDAERQRVYASSDYHCVACGVHKSMAKGPKWLEAHEFFQMDYMTGRCEVVSIEPLCHFCHNFIHSGRLQMIAGIQKTEDEVNEILEHGLMILSRHGLDCFAPTLDMAIARGCKTFGVRPSRQSFSPHLGWNDFFLVLNGREYRSKFRSIDDWKKHYANQ